MGQSKGKKQAPNGEYWCNVYLQGKPKLASAKLVNAENMLFRVKTNGIVVKEHNHEVANKIKQYPKQLKELQKQVWSPIPGRLLWFQIYMHEADINEFFDYSYS